jgi:hypothetical protein
MPFLSRMSILAAWLLAVGSVAGTVFAQTAWREGFEGPTPSWQNVGGDARYRILQQQRIQGDAHSGKTCEWVKLEGEGGTHVYLAQDVGRPPVIEELAARVWIKSDRPGLQLAARIVLPRALDPRTGQPVTAVLLGDVYKDVGRWQPLQVAEVPKLLTRQVHVLRMNLGSGVDDREAYLDAVMLNVYGGPGTTNVWIDDLEIAGHAGPVVGPALTKEAVEGPLPQNRGGSATTTPTLNPVTPTTNTANPTTNAATPRTTSEGTSSLVPVRLPPVASNRGNRENAFRPLPRSPLLGERLPPIQSAPKWTAPIPRQTVKLDRSLLIVNDAPFFPRVIQHRGEPLKTLQKLGFNAVWLQRLPAPEVLEEANRLEIWLICPPPRPVDSGAGPAASGQVSAVAEIGPQFDCVLAWDLGGDLTGADLDATQRWADQVREADRRGNRPMICRPRAELSGFSRLPALLLIDRRPIGTSLELSSYATWVRQQPLLASPGTPVWSTVQTQPNEPLRQQLAGLEPGYVPPLTVSPEQIRLLAYTAVASGSRGLVFASDSPLDASDSDTHLRAMSLELLNLELELMEPWAAGGTYFTTAEPSVPEVAATVLGTDYAKLLLPIWASPGAQCVPSQSAANALTIKVPGVPDSTDAYELTPAGAKSIRHLRKTGGVKVTLDEFGLTSQILLSQYPTIISKVHSRAAQIGRRSAELQCLIALERLHAVQLIAGRLASRVRVPSSAAWLDAARKNLQPCDAQLVSGDATGAALNAQRAMRSLRLIERAYWDAAIQNVRNSPVTSPAALSFDTLPSHLRLIDRLSTLSLSPNRLAGGDFEDLDRMTGAGWRYFLHSTPTVQTSVDLAPQAALSGRRGLRLAVFAVDAKKPPAVIESPPILFTSPGVQVEAGQIVCIHGWARVPNAITAGTDGLLVVDSISGEALAARIGKTDGWKEFALYRVATQSGPMCVHFALSGLGEAWLDDVAIQVFENPGNTVLR